MPTALLAKGPLARATVRTTQVLVLRLLTQAGTLLLLVQLLGSAGFGALAGLSSIAIMLGSLSTWGTHLRLLKRLSAGDGERVESVAEALGTTAAVAGALFLLYLGGCWFFMSAVIKDVAVVLGIGIAEIVLQPFLLIVAAECQARHWIARSQLLIVLPLFFRLALALIAWLLNVDDPLHWYAVGYCLVTLASLCVGLRVLPLSWPGIRHWRLLSGRSWLDGAGFALLGLSSRGPAEIDKVMAVHLLPLSAAGAYAAASRVVGATVLPTIALMLAAMPRLFAMSSKAKRGATPAIFFAAAGYGACAAVAIWGAAPFMPMMLGHGFHGTEVILQVLAFGIPGLSLRIAAAGVLMSAGPWTRFILELGGVAVLVVVAAALEGRAWPAALPAAVVASEWMMAVLGWVMICARSKSPSGPEGACM